VNRLYLVLFLLPLAACGGPAGNEAAPAAEEPSATASHKPAEAPPSASFEEAQAAAIAAIERSAARDHAWSSADNLLKQAVAAAAAGDEDKAIELADRARVQAELALRQADLEETAWRERVLSD